MKVLGYKRSKENLNEIEEAISTLNKNGIDIEIEEEEGVEVPFTDYTNSDYISVKINVADIPKDIKTIEFYYDS